MTMTNSQVLVVEDEVDGQEVIRGILDHANIAADAVGTAEDALTLLQQNSYRAVVIDLALPGMDGMELLATIRQNSDTAHLPCIAATAFHTSAVKQDALAAGFDAYFSKPLDDAAFIQEMGRILSQN